MDQTAVNRRILHKDFVCESIFEQIKSGKLKPGDRITELQLASEFNVSQAPIREALRDLEGMGVIESIPFKGNYIKKLTFKELCDFYRVRAGLEIIGVKYAIKKITDDEVNCLEEILKKMNKAGKECDSEAFIKYDVEFHQYFIEVAENKELLKMWNKTHVRTWTALNTKITKLDEEQLALRHQSIFDAIKNRDTETACKLVELHLEELIQELALSDNDEIRF